MGREVTIQTPLCPGIVPNRTPQLEEGVSSAVQSAYDAIRRPDPQGRPALRPASSPPADARFLGSGTLALHEGSSSGYDAYQLPGGEISIQIRGSGKWFR